MKKYLPIASMVFLFSACFDSGSLEKDKEICKKDNKNFYVTETLNYRTGKLEPKVICK